MIKKPAKASRKQMKSDLRDKILQAMLSQAPFDGWTETAYGSALQQTGITRAEANKQFSEGLRDCVEYFGITTDEAMQARIKAERGFDRMRVRDKITFGVRARLEILKPHREAMRRLMIWYAMPQHIPMGLKRFYQTVDMIWAAAGDTSTDYNFYTKRILLAAVLKSTLLFWLSDESKNNTATWDFLDRRIADVMKLGKSISLLKEFKPSEIVDLIRDKIQKAL